MLVVRVGRIESYRQCSATLFTTGPEQLCLEMTKSNKDIRNRKTKGKRNMKQFSGSICKLEPQTAIITQEANQRIANETTTTLILSDICESILIRRESKVETPSDLVQPRVSSTNHLRSTQTSTPSCNIMLLYTPSLMTDQAHQYITTPKTPCPILSHPKSHSHIIPSTSP